MKLMLKQNRWQLAAAVAAVLGLFFFFAKAQAVDPVTHNQLVSDIAQLQRLDTELGEAVLQLHYRLANNYDSVTALMRRIKELDEALEQAQHDDLLPLNAKVSQELASLRLKIATKELQLDEFKSHNAVMKNSLLYLSSMTAEILALLPKSDDVLLEKFEFLLRDALMVSVNGDEESFGVLELDILKVEQAIPGMPNNAKELAIYILRHSKTLLEADKVMPDLLNELSTHQMGRLGTGLDKLYQDYYQEQQRTAARYRIFLLLAAMLMLAYSLFVYFRLKEKRQQLELALAEVSNQQHALNEHAIVSITDVRGNIIYVNDKFVKISGYSSEELIGHNHRMVKSDEHSSEFYRDLWHTVANGQVWHGQVKNRAKDGSYYWVEATVVPFMDKSSKPYQYVSMRTDITAQKAMEQQVQAERSLLKSVMDTLGEGVYMLDLQGNCTYLNSEAEAIIGWTIEEIAGRNLHDVIHSQLPDGTQVAADDCPIRCCMAEKKVYRSETEYFQHKNGTLFPVSIVASPVLNEGEIVGSVAAFQDISERKFTERELLRAKDAAEAASRAKGDFLATMSHEIRTPMNGIIGMTELALDTELNAEQREYLGLVKSSADALLIILNDILDFSKIESGKMELELVEFDPRALFSSTEKILALRASQRGLELVYDVSGEIPDRLMGDPGRLRQVLTNLIGNAIKFSEDSVVMLNMKFLKRQSNAVTVRIEIVDQGIGIPADKLAHIFEAFTQADTSTTRKYGGTGLGLAISSQLVAAMGGHLTVESELGCGSVFGFTVDFPVAVTQPVVNSVTGLAGLSVLVVDDNLTNLHLLSSLLAKWGMHVVTVENAFDALAEINVANLQGHAFELLLLDAMMPDKDGFELAKELQGMPLVAHGAVMMLSSAGLREDAQRCRDLGIAAYLTKPIDQTDLLNAIQTALGIARTPEPASRLIRAVEAKSLSILLAEDNPVNQKLAITLLEKWGHRVVLANNGQEAIEHSRLQVFDVILMDLQMPVMGGLEATQIIRLDDLHNGKHTPIVAMTANAMQEDRQRCLDAGMDDYIAKPLNTELLRDLLQSITQAEMTNQDIVAVAAESSQITAITHAEFDYAAALVKADEWVIETIGHDFLKECDVQMAVISSAIQYSDNELLLRAAHTLRGLAGNFNAKPVEDIARRIEHFSEQGDLSQAIDLFENLKVELGELKLALLSCLEKLAAR